jgi:enoyl-CoA hydratase/carnithine racemase
MGITYDVRDRIAYLAFSRPEKHNAVRLEEIVGLAECFTRFDHDPDADVAILHGPGPSFSSGGDLVATQAELAAGGVDAQSAAERRVRAAIFEATNFKPAIAAIHGNCLGNAVGWAFMCDLVVAARGTRLQITETRFGLAPTNFWLVMGAGAFALDVTLTARGYTAEEAFRAGAIARLADEGEHVAEAELLARQILANPQQAVREVVRVRRSVTSERMLHVRQLTGTSTAGFGRGAGGDELDAAVQAMER